MSMKRFKKLTAAMLSLFLIGNAAISPAVYADTEDDTPAVVQEATETFDDTITDEVTEDAAGTETVISDTVIDNASEADEVSEESTISDETIAEEAGDTSVEETEIAEVTKEETDVTADEAETDVTEIEATEAQETEEETKETEAENAPVVVEQETKTEPEKLLVEVDGVSTSGIDFSSKELLIGTEDPSVFTKDTIVVSEYNGIYLTQYASVEQTRVAYTYYYNKVDFVSANITFKVADEGYAADMSSVNAGDDALANLNEMNPVRTPDRTIALIDTGVNTEDVVDAVSVLGESTADDNGHGTAMYNYIKAEYPNAKILSIKAMDEDGYGKADAIVAAIRYAVESKVDVINLSLSAYSTKDNTAVRTAIEEAVEKGIMVVGAAGNNGNNAKYYIAGSIDAAIIVGACDANGVRLETSNYGTTVDYNVEASSTSEAAAKMSAIIAKNNGKSSVGVFTPDFNETEYLLENDFDGLYYNTIFKDGTFIIADSIDINEKEPTVLTLDNVKSDVATYGLSGYIANKGTQKSPSFVYYQYDASNSTYTEYNTHGICIDNGFRSIGTHSYSPVQEYDVTDTNILKLVYYGAKEKNYTAEQLRPYLVKYFNAGKANIISGSGSGHIYLSNNDAVKAAVKEWENGSTNAIVKAALERNASPSVATVYNYRNGVTADSSMGTGNVTIPEGCESYDDFITNAMKIDVPNGFYVKELLGLTRYSYILHEAQNHSDGLVYQSALIWGELNAPDLYYASVWKDGMEINGKKDFSGAVYGLYDLPANASEASFEDDNHLIAMFVMDENGFATSINTSYNVFSYGHKCLAFYNYCTDRGWNAMAIYTAKQHEYIQRFMCFNKEGLDLTNKSFSFKEIKAPKDYILNKKPIAATISTAKSFDDVVMVGSEYNNTKISNAVDDAYDNGTTKVVIQKNSADTTCTNGNVNYSLAGAQYVLYDAAGLNSLTKDTSGNYTVDQTKALKNTNGNTIILTTDATGKTGEADVSTVMKQSASTGDILDTEIYALELKAPKHFELNKKPASVVVKKENVSGNAAVITTNDNPVQDPFNAKVVKKGDDTTKLEGAEFTLKFYPEDITKNYTYAQLQNKTATITKTYTTNANGIATINEDTFPMGYITLEETKAPENYLLPGSTDKATIKLNDNSTIQTSVKMAYVLDSKSDGNGGYENDGAYLVENGNRTTQIAKEATVGNEFLYTDDVIRGNIQLHKQDSDTDDDMEGIKFRINRLDANNNVVETHYIYTNANGHATTVTTDYTNANYYDNVNDYDGTESVVWFGDSLADNAKNALPAGDYTIREMPCKANNNYQYGEEFPFSITKDNYQNTQTIETYNGIYYNTPNPTFNTVASSVLDPQDQTDTKMVPASAGQTIIDKVIYKNLKCDTEFTLVGEIWTFDEDGNPVPFEQNGTPVTATKTFTTRAKTAQDKTNYVVSDTETVTFTDLDFTGIQDQRFVIYETLYLGTDTTNPQTKYPEAFAEDDDLFPMEHKNPDDPAQTVHTPNGPTTAEDVSGKKVITYTNTVTLIDKVYYTGLETDGRSYEITGTLHVRPENDPEDKEYTEAELDAMILKDKDGKPVTNTVPFVPTQADGVVEIPFTFDVDLITGTESTIVVFEDCKYKKTGITVFTHADIHDKGQTLYHPSISTTAKTIDERMGELAADSENFLDVIDYTNMAPETEVKVEGVAMDKNTGKALLLDGREVKASDTFTTGKSNRTNGAVDGSFTLKFTIDEKQQADLKGKDLVIFETFYVYDAKEKVWKVAAEHSDLEDVGQELRVPTLHTRLTDTKTKTHVAYPDQIIELQDEVSYSLLIPGKKYVMTGTLYKRPENVPVGTKLSDEELAKLIVKDENGKPITASQPFTASETGNGTVTITFKVNEKYLYDNGMKKYRSVVAFESCKPENTDVEVACHAEIWDEDQTVDVPSVHTTASGKMDTSTGKLSVLDVISYTNLTPGLRYTAHAVLVNADGTPVVVDGKAIEADVDFTPEERDGTIGVSFPSFDPYYQYPADAKYKAYKYVVFEEVYVNVTEEDGTVTRHLIGEHKDLNDTNQTVNDFQTGDETPVALFIGLFALAMAGIGVLIWRRRKLNK